MWRWTIRVLVGLTGLMILAALAGATYQWLATRKDLASTPPPGQLVDIGGYRLHLWCTGDGAPAVILDTGLGGSTADWGFVQPDVARFTRVCSYDRAGMGYSDPGPAPRTSRHIASELAELLATSGIDAPLVLVGASSGGFNVRVFASDHPARVAGLVLLEASHEDQAHEIPRLARFVPLLSTIGVLRLLGVSVGLPVESQAPSTRDFARATRFRAAGYQAAAGEIMHIRESASEVRSSRRKLTIPVFVVTGGRGADTTWQQLQQDHVSLSERGCQIVAEQSGHVVAIDQPEVVVGAIRTVVDMARGHDVPPCGTLTGEAVSTHSNRRATLAGATVPAHRRGHRHRHQHARRGDVIRRFMATLRENRVRSSRRDRCGFSRRAAQLSAPKAMAAAGTCFRRPFQQDLPWYATCRIGEIARGLSLQEPAMSTRLSRRRFLARSIAVTAAAPAVMSVEEHQLLARNAAPGATAPEPMPRSKRWMGRIGNVSISRVICGGNLISGYAHSRDLIYVSPLLKHYHTEAKVMETWALCEEHGLNTMIAYAGDRRAVSLYRKYRKRGGKIQYLAQINPDPRNLRAAVTDALEAEAVGAFLVGNTGDLWSRANAVGRIAEVVGLIKDADLIAGVAGHELRTPRVCEAGSVDPDFYVKTLHDRNYWSKQQPGQDRDVIDNYAIDNYWCQEPENVIGFMSRVARPWIAFKVLAAGAIHPKDGFKYAFQNGADFAAVGMFDFQVAENVLVANTVLTDLRTRNRAWSA